MKLYQICFKSLILGKMKPKIWCLFLEYVLKNTCSLKFEINWWQNFCKKIKISKTYLINKNKKF
jgi:hypothetical protein